MALRAHKLSGVDGTPPPLAEATKRVERLLAISGKQPELVSRSRLQDGAAAGFAPCRLRVHGSQQILWE
jgi:hypothetical protein